MSNFKPLLAATYEASKVDLTAHQFFASPKLDGIRAIVINGVVVSRSLKPIPNKRVQELFKHLEGYDGELIVGSPTADDCYRVTNSAVMSKDGVPDVQFCVFDRVDMPHVGFATRLKYLDEGRCVRVVPHVDVDDEARLSALESDYLALGYEGVMIRRADALYKQGRSTLKEGALIKVKQFTDDEATVIGFEEEFENLNEATVNALGHTERSSHQANKRGKGTLGALVCVTKDGAEFRIGTGFKRDERQALWDRRDTLPGSTVKFKSFLIGVKVAPRFPTFLGFRDSIDM